MIEIHREQEVLDSARKLFHGGADWVTLYREVLGVRGLIRRLFPTHQELTQFEQTEAYQEIQLMLRELRQRGVAAGAGLEPTRVITVRLPRSLHDALKTEAHEHETSMNKLCISKLLQFIDKRLVPTDSSVLEDEPAPTE